MLDFIPRYFLQRRISFTHEILKQIHAQPAMDSLSDSEIAAEVMAIRTQLLESDLSIAQVRAKQLKAASPRLFALAKEAVKRAIGLTPYDEQLAAGLALGRGLIVEMGTGEGKTLTIPFGALMCFVQGLPVHVCTVNTYLAQRDANMMFPVYNLLGMSVAAVHGEQTQETRREAYRRDVVYGTHQLFAMDYLRDKLVLQPTQIRQVRGHGAVIVDEADAVLIDDARTPLVLTMPVPASLADFASLRTIALALAQDADFTLDLANRNAVLTDTGYEKVGGLLREHKLLAEDDEDYCPRHQTLLLAVSSALGAEYLLQRDQAYVVVDGAITLVDPLTGRLQPDRSWDSGLQQAIETKEGLTLSPDAKVLGKITLKNFFALYSHLCGLTGTALTDQEEFQSVYGLSVVAIDPHFPRIRQDLPDRFFFTAAEKLSAVISDVVARHAAGQPVLVGTASIDQSQAVAEALQACGVACNVLNAKHHADEGLIIAQAGQLGAVTVATNMAGRGTDIVLGGNVGMYLAKKAREYGSFTESEVPQLAARWRKEHAAARQQVVATGGLHVIGLERYETRRMDMQLRGRSGRQGDPGSTQFYVSLEDPMVAAHAAERIEQLMAILDVSKGEELHAKLIIDAINQAQHAEQTKYASLRKTLLEEDDVLDVQRAAYYAMRDDLFEDLSGASAGLCVDAAIYEVAQDLMSRDPEDPVWAAWSLTPADSVEEIQDALQQQRTLKIQSSTAFDEFRSAAQAAQLEFSVPVVERLYCLRALDAQWVAHLEALSQAKKGMHLRAYAKEDPKQAFQKEAFALYKRMLDSAFREIARLATSLA